MNLGPTIAILRNSLAERKAISELNALSALCEEAGVEVPDGTTVDELLQAEADILDGLEEKFGQKLKAAFGKVKAAFRHKPRPPAAKHTFDQKRPKSKMWVAGRSREIARNM